MQLDISFRGQANPGEVEKLLKDLIEIESINSFLPGATTGEDRIGNYVLEYLTGIGVKCSKQEVLPGRFNVVGFLPGRTRDGLCFETHMDTVSVDNMQIDPFKAETREGNVYGRGSCDAKASLAAMIYAFKLLLQNEIQPATDIYLAAVVEEEHQHKGVTYLLRDGFRVRGAVVGEPTELKVVIACKGVVRWKLHTLGKAGHSSRVDGRNAIYDMSEVIECIKRELIPTYSNRTHPLLGSPTISVGVISGGTFVNIVPDKCTIDIDRRLLPGEAWESVNAEFAPILKKLQDKYGIEVVMEAPFVIDEAMATDGDAVVVKLAQNACKEIIGSSEVVGVSYGCDATKFHRAGIPAVVLGPGNILHAHAAVEYVPLEDVLRASEIYAQMCTDYR
jgi:succinyl-diaminopimelate desuccinylase